MAVYGSDDQGGNVNWVFVSSSGMNVWTGDVSSDWGNGTNWSLGRVSVATDDVLIPAGRPHDPLLDFHKRVQSLEIENGASLGLNGFDLLVDNVTAIGVALNATGAETLTFNASSIVTVAHFEVVGRSGHPVLLRSSADGDAWKLVVTSILHRIAHVPARAPVMQGRHALAD